MASSLSQRAQRGAKWLDEVCPGWADFVSTETLDLSNEKICILGQLNTRDMAPKFWDLAEDAGHNCTSTFGFVLPDELFSDGREPAAWRKLTEVWAREVEARRTPPKAGAEFCNKAR